MKTNKSTKSDLITIGCDLGGEGLTKCRGTYKDGFKQVGKIKPKFTDEDRAEKTKPWSGWRWLKMGEVTTSSDKYMERRWDKAKPCYEAVAPLTIDHTTIGWYARKT